MTVENTDFGKVADDLRRAAASFTLLTSEASLFGVALGAFRQFEKQLVSTNAIAQGTVANFRQMEAAARGFALATTSSATDVVTALENLAQAGFTASESLTAMTGVMLLASATLNDVGQTADLITSSIRAFGLAASDSTRVANLFAAANVNSLATMDKLIFAMRQVAPVAQVANLSIEETTGWLNELFNVGLRGEQAGTALRNIIIRLIRPTGAAAETLRELGISTVDATGNFRDLQTILQEIGNANLSEAQLAKIFENEALAGAITLIKAARFEADKGSSAFERQVKAISGTQKALLLTIENLQSFDGAMKLTKNSVTDLAITVGEYLAPYVRELADFIRETLKAFRELDPETKAFYTQMLTVGAAIVSVMAAMNAMILLFGNAARIIASVGLAIGGLPLLIGVTALGAYAGGWGTVIAAVTGAIAVFKLVRLAIVGWQAAAAAFTTFMAGPFVAAVTAAAEAMLLFALSNPFTAAITLTAAIVGLALAYDAVTTSAEEAADAMDRAARVKAANDAAATEVQGTSGNSTLDIAQAQKNLQIITDLLDSELIRQLTENDPGGAFSSAKNAADMALVQLDQLEQSERNLLTKFADVADLRFQLEAAIAADAPGRAIFGVSDTYYTDQFLNSLTDDQRARLDALNAQLGVLDGLETDTANAITTAGDRKVETAERLLQSIISGKTALDPIYADLLPSIQAFLSDEEFMKRVADALSGDKDGVISNDDILTAIFTDPSFTDPVEATGALMGYLKRREQVKVQKFVADLGRIEQDLAVEHDKATVEVFEFVNKNAADLQEAITAGFQGAILQSEIDVTKLSSDFVKDYGEDLQKYIQLNQEGIGKVVDDILKANGYDKLLDSPGIDELFSGAGLIEAVKARTDENTTPEEFAQIGREEAAKYKAVMLLMIDSLAKAMELDETQVAQLKNIATGQITRISDAILEGARTGSDAAADAAERVAREQKAAADAVSKALKEARDAMKEARKIEDIFIGMAKDINEARKTVLESTAGFTVDQRIQLTAEFEVEDIKEKYNAQIRSLMQSIEDVTFEFKGTPQQLLDIKAGYGQLIDEIEAARDAELAAANAFTASMARRSAALKLFERDLVDLGMASKDAYTQVGVGIASAFAEYQSDLITLIDITKDATSGLLDTLTQGVSDFIFENENAWESFKKNMLNISKQIFEGFTKALLQQTISSITGGEGSFLGSAVMPSSQRNTGTPGIGNGGVFARMFPGLAGLFGNKSANGPLGQSDATDTAQAYRTHLAMQQAIFREFETGLRGALSTVVNTVRDMATDGTLTGTFAGVGAAVGGVMVPGVGAALGSRAGAAIAGEADIFAGLVQRGLSEAAAAGAVGNFVQESALNPAAVGDNGNAYGLAQWNGPRMRELQRYAASTGRAVDDVNTQLDFFVQELQTTEKGVGASLAGIQDAGQAADIIAKDFERPAPATANYERRVAEAQRIAATYGNGQGGVAAGPAGMPLSASTGTSATGALTGKSGADTLAGGIGGTTDQSTAFNDTFTQFITAITQTLNQFGTQFAAAMNAALQQMGGTGGVTFAGVGTASVAAGLPGVGAGGGQGLGLLKSVASLFGFSEGGYTGNGQKYDVAGIVHAGEFVTNANATKEFLPLLEAMNSGNLGKLPGFADGGLVGSVGLPRSASSSGGGNNIREGDSITISPVYNIPQGANPDAFARSASQHAKQLARMMERAKRNA